MAGGRSRRSSGSSRRFRRSRRWRAPTTCSPATARCSFSRRCPHKAPDALLADLVQTTPGQEGRWFASAKHAELYDEALALARRSPCDPGTLTRAARDFAERRPEFAVEAGLLALHWLVDGYGYEITNLDVLAAYTHTMQVAEQLGTSVETRQRVRQIVAQEADTGRFVGRSLERVLREG